MADTVSGNINLQVDPGVLAAFGSRSRVYYKESNPAWAYVGVGLLVLFVVLAFLFFFGGWFNTHREDRRADLRAAAAYETAEAINPSPAAILSGLPPIHYSAPPATVVAGNVYGEHSDGVAHPDGPGHCVMGPPHQGEVGYVWSDGRCHHLAPDGVSDGVPHPGPGINIPFLHPEEHPTQGGHCPMTGEHAGESGYVWSDGRCHHLPPV